MIENLINLYEKENLSIVSIANKLDLPIALVYSNLKENNVKFRKPGNRIQYPLNENFFSKIDTEEKAYFLGLLYADGTISDNGTVKIRLIEQDKHILDNFKKCLETDRPLYYIGKKNVIIRGKQTFRSPSWELALHSKKMQGDLINLGCGPRKSLILKFPNEKQVPKDLLRHFVRGYFDGDGCLTSTKNKYNKKIYQISLCVSNDFGDEYKNTMKSILDIHVTISKLKNNKIQFAGFGGLKQVEKFLNWIYENSKIHFFRKYDKYIDFKEFVKLYKKPFASKYMGVTYNKPLKKFVAFCRVNNKSIHLGVYINEDDAAIAFNKFVTENKLNKQLNVI